MTELELHRSAAVLDVACEVTLPGCQVTLVLRNASDGALGYKAMTNAPRRWSVRPNGGVIEAGALGRSGSASSGPSKMDPARTKEVGRANPYLHRVHSAQLSAHSSQRTALSDERLGCAL